ncbi:toxin-antitoxin system YwqK family antitoxin [Marinomonas sp. FW-1]|uniref:toxin-antitoxin system YwqK family antitoxin n=1 Tax=Marinomonas sp. FW-1 TaxID=2071621 RepID=UPI0010C0E8BF|nr:hypothetical protein [Marinomonas sp. FW-1]
MSIFSIILKKGVLGVFLILGALLLNACSPAPVMKSTVDEKQLEEIQCTPSQREGFSHLEDCLMGYKGKPFTGLAVKGDPADYFSATMYQKGKQDGVSYSSRKGRLTSQDRFKDGLRSGESTQYDSYDGKLVSRIIYLDGQKLEAFYYDDGIITSYYRFKEGKEIEYTRYNLGLKWRRTFYQGDRKLLEESTYYANGQLESVRIRLDNSLKLLDRTDYYSNGKVEMQFYFDEKNNTVQELFYWRNGQRRRDSNYVYDGRYLKLDGEYRSFCEEDGRLNEVSHYRMGVLHGVSEEFYCNGQRKTSTLHYEQGVIVDKEVATYRDDGAFYKVEKMDGKGNILKTLHYDAEGKYRPDW